jgi:thioredoxin-related protein
MKYILSIIILTSLIYSNLLESISFNEAVKKANIDNKGIMIMYGQDNCYASNRVHNKTFENTDLVPNIQKNFHYVYVNISQEKKLRGFSVRGTPTFYFLNKDKKILKRLIGAVPAKVFNNILNKALEKNNEEEIN